MHPTRQIWKKNLERHQLERDTVQLECTKVLYQIMQFERNILGFLQSRDCHLSYYKQPSCPSKNQ